MKNSKFQIPNSKEIPMCNSEGEVSTACGLREGSALPPEKPYDLDERTALFGESVVRFAKTISRGPGNDRLINQLVGAGTSLGANYAEASETVSRKDFKYAISRCVKEAKENALFPTHGRGGRTAAGGRSSQLVSGSPGTSLDFRQHVSQMKIPKSKSQVPRKFQSPKPIQCRLEFDACSFFGIWNLEFGTSPQ